MCTSVGRQTVNYGTAELSISNVNADVSGDSQEEYDRLYGVLMQLVADYYSECTVALTSTDPLYIKTAVKSMLRRKNQLLRRGGLRRRQRLLRSTVMRAELCRVDVVDDARTMWTKVRQLSGRGKAANSVGNNATITADSMNVHFADIPKDAGHRSPYNKSQGEQSKRRKSYHRLQDVQIARHSIYHQLPRDWTTSRLDFF